MKRKRVGRVSFYESKAELPPGPRTLAELQAFAANLAPELASADCWPTLKDGLVVESDYSGMDVPILVLRRLQHHLEGLGKHLHLVHYRSCDIGALQQMTLQGSESPPMHIFRDLLERVPACWSELVPPMSGEVSPEQCREFAKLLNDHLCEIFTADNTSHCIVHGSACKVSAAVSDHQTGEQPPLKVHIAGPSCTAWSSFGKRRGLEDKSAVPWHIWLTERMALQEDLIVVENSVNLPPTLLVDALARSHVIAWSYISPEDLGWPTHRPRLFMACIKKTSLQWLQPVGNVTTLLMEQYARTVEVDGDVFLVDSEANRSDYLAGMMPEEQANRTLCLLGLRAWMWR